MRKQCRYLNNLNSALYCQGQRIGFTIGLINLGFYGHINYLPQHQQAGAVFPPLSAISGCWKPQSPHISSTTAVTLQTEFYTPSSESKAFFSSISGASTHNELCPCISLAIPITIFRQKYRSLKVEGRIQSHQAGTIICLRR